MPATVPYDGAFELEGHDLGGEQVELLLRDPRTGAPLAADASWAVSAQPTRLTAVARTTIDGETLLPGVYAASVRTGRTVDGRLLRRTSNQTPIQITPAIAAVSAIAGGRFRVDGGLFDDAAIAAEDREVHLGAEQLARVNAAPAPGEYRIVNPGRIELAPAAGAPTGQDLPLRILVNGAETPPRWIRLP
jgi:hypothetical protein